MAKEPVVIEITLVEAQILAAGGDPSKIRPAGAGAGSGGFPPRAGTVTPATEEQREYKFSGRAISEFQRGLQKGERLEKEKTRELETILSKNNADILRDRRRDERVAAKEAAAEARALARGAPTGAGGVRRRRGRPGRGPLGAAVASGAAAGAAGIARPFGASAAAAAASGASIAAATFPAAAAGVLAVLAPAMSALGLAVFATTKAFNEMEDLIDARIFQAKAIRGVREIQGRLRRGERIGGEVAGFITSSSQLDQAIRDAGAEILKELLPVVTSIFQQLTVLTEDVTPFIGPTLAEFKIFMQKSLEAYISFLPLGKEIQEALDDLLRTAQLESDRKDAVDRLATIRAFESFDPANFNPRDIPGIGGI